MKFAGRQGKFFLALLLLLLLSLLIVPRLIWLDADPWPLLDWSSGIWTDEGFYTYNARNRVLFGTAELDEFNNRNLMPVLDAVQVAVFSRFGVSLVVARMISVVASLLTLLLFWDALRRVFGRRVALYGLLFLGCEATFILYNRLALMETPSTLIHVLALWCLALGNPLGFLLAGFFAAGTMAFKTTYLLLLPAPLLAMVFLRDANLRKNTVSYLLGAVIAGTLYLTLWGVGHQREILRMNTYYRVHQIQPRSIVEAVYLFQRSVLGYKDGAKRHLLQFLETRTPILTTLALIGLLAPATGTPKTTKRQMRRLLLARTLIVWAATGLFLLAVSRYSPSRYFLVIYPALAGLAALTLARLPLLWRWWRRSRRQAVIELGVPIFLLMHHLSAPLWSGERVFAPDLFAALTAVLVVLAGSAVITKSRFSAPRPALALGLFLLISGGLWTHWGATRQYVIRDTSRLFGHRYRAGTVILGDRAPELMLENRLRGVPVFQGLANDHAPARTLRAGYILVAQTPVVIQLWRGWAPDVVRPENRLALPLWVGGVEMHLYRVP